MRTVMSLPDSRAAAILYLLLSCAAVARSAFTFEFEIVRHRTNGNCAGIDLSIPCETFVNYFCLRGPAFVGDTNTDNSNCPLGLNNIRVFDVVPQTRTIQSNQPWPTFFQLFIGAFDDDHPFTSFDFLDNIFIDSSRSISSQFSTATTYWGVNNKVGVDIRFRVTCQPNYYSADCSVFCLARDDSSGHYTCDPVDGSIVCRDGFEHPETSCVDRITACSSSPCQRGSCIAIGLTDFTCACPPGYTGKQCEAEINECDPNPCLNGTCMDLLADYSCACNPGYTGKDCDIDINECLQAECVENAHCVHGINSYECVCDLGFEGPNCTEIDPCDSSPCALTGLCQSDGPFHYNCSCDPGYTGPTCEDDIDDCPTADCPLNSDCVDRVNSYTCVCRPGFTGGNCTTMSPPVVVGGPASSPSSSGALIGGAVGSLMLVLILLVLIAIVVTLIVISKRRERSKRYRSYDLPENAYDIEPMGTLQVEASEPIINNPLYSTNSTSPEPTSATHNDPDSNPRASPDIELSTSPAYNATLRNVNNPLYGGATPSPAHKPGDGPIYSEPVKADLTTPKKGAENYPYSYALVDHDRRSSTKGSVKVAPPPDYEQVASNRTPAAGPQYEDVEFKPVQNGDAPIPNGYQVPKPVTPSQSSAPHPLVYHYATTDSTVKSKPPKLEDAVATSKEVPSKKSIYDSQDDDTVETPQKPSKPIPPPRTKPAVPSKPEVYSYATTDTARASVKIKGLDEGSLPPYNRLEHDLGPDVTAHQIRLANVEGSGYEALQNE